MQQVDLFNPSDPTQSRIELDRIVGVDEVGRGPLIGEVVAAAVILPKNCQLELKDSKKLSHLKRVELAERIKEQALEYAIMGVSPEQIDQLNILQATLLAMKKAVEKLTQPFEEVWVDGNRCPDFNCPCQAIVKGDGLVLSISAASILAKVYRDQQMELLHQQYPLYGFDQHKGYPTKAHLAAIEKYGLIEGYRKSFRPISQFYG
ncbi:ribonuclease HII [Thiomicrospira microaerophila]|uniref:ribonuclease HII n=1 Tax=Thiomicrospira microaerophila TaxID=406020 RepID=UPI00200C7790|nr:ribonuclease HII [Thiomicrospira microaerophila]UQB41370.1 ribonuclease HII [Thiomicrospira microaerophila]